MALDYTSPGYAFTQELQKFLLQREAQKHQDLLDSLAVKREQDNQQLQQAQLASLDAQRQALEEQRRQQTAQRTSSSLNPGDVIGDATAGILRAGGMADAVTPQMSLPGRSIAMTTAAPSVSPADADQTSGTPAVIAPAPTTASTALPTVDAGTGRLVYKGTPEQLQKQALLAQQKAAFEKLNSADAPTDPVQRYMLLRQAMGGEAIPYQLVEPQSTTEPVYRQNPRTGQIEKVGEVPKGTHFMTEPAPTGNDITSPAYQGKLEQQYRQALLRPLSNRSGGLGLEDAKVNQAIHLKALLDQNYDPKTGNYNVPTSQLNELALGLARLVSPNGQVGIELMHELNQRTSKGDLAGALSYVTGVPVTGNTQAVIKMFKDSIDRQGATAEQNRDQYMDYLRALAPTDLDPARQQRLESGMLNSYVNPKPPKASTGSNGAGSDMVTLRDPSTGATRQVSKSDPRYHAYIAAGAVEVK